MPVYQHVAAYDAAVEDVWAWYDSPGAFRRIMPEWEGIRPIKQALLRTTPRQNFVFNLGRSVPCGSLVITMWFPGRCSMT